MTTASGHPGHVIKSCTLHPFTVQGKHGAGGGPTGTLGPNLFPADCLSLEKSLPLSETRTFALWHLHFIPALKVHDHITLAQGHCHFFKVAFKVKKFED